MAANIRKNDSGDFFVEIDGISIKCTLQDIAALNRKSTSVCAQYDVFDGANPIDANVKMELMEKDELLGEQV